MATVTPHHQNWRDNALPWQMSVSGGRDASNRIGLEALQAMRSLLPTTQGPSIQTSGWNLATSRSERTSGIAGQMPPFPKGESDSTTVIDWRP